MTGADIAEENESIILKPFYVYVLADPLCDNQIFYVGKGKSKRGFDHLKDALKADIEETPKLARIRLIYKAGLEPLVRVISRFDSEEEAFAVESVLIHWVYGYEYLTNEQSGHGSRYVRPKLDGLKAELAAIDIPRNIKLIGKVRTGYTQGKIDNHLRLNHAEMMEDLYAFLSAGDIPLHPQGVIALENGRYLAITIELNESAILALQITDTDKHSIIPNLRSKSDRKVDRELFSAFVADVFSLKAKNGGRYAKLKSWEELKISVVDHSYIYQLIVNTLEKCSRKIG